MTYKEKLVFCRDAFLVIDNIAFFSIKGKDVPKNAFKVVDVNNKRSMTVQMDVDGFTVLNSNLSEKTYYKARYFMEVNRRTIRNEVFKNT